jgi:hypothetical protein
LARYCSRAATVVLVMMAKQQRIEPPPFEPRLQRARGVSSSRVHKNAAHVPRCDLVARGGEAAEEELDSATMVVDNQVHAIILRSLTVQVPVPHGVNVGTHDGQLSVALQRSGIVSGLPPNESSVT